MMRSRDLILQTKTFFVVQLGCNTYSTLQLEVRCSGCKSFDWLNVDLGLILERINLCKISVVRCHYVDIS